MPYRHNPRLTHQRDDLFRAAGVSLTWRQFVSASAGNPTAGLGDARHYREQTITALIGSVGQTDSQTPAGLLPAGELTVTTRERLASADELIWNGATWHIDGDPIPARIAGTWVSRLKRGITTG